MFLCCALFAIQWMLPPDAFAVGGGVPFVFREGQVPGAMQHAFAADSMDFTYHACADFDAADFVETGYLWISSFQDVDSVVDSQINYFMANGYHLYARYQFHAEECSGQQTCNFLDRKNYRVDQAALSLYLDPLQDTLLALQNCGVAVANGGDDVFLGAANAILSGQKSETDDQANGDFDIVFSNWFFTAAGQALFKDGNGNPLAIPTLVFNANVTILGGLLGDDHRPEGSGNLYWTD
jgi:hypothetical protein